MPGPGSSRTSDRLALHHAGHQVPGGIFLVSQTDRTNPGVAARPSRPYDLTAAEVIGSFSPTRLAADLAASRVVGHAPVTAHADAPPPTVGVGQSPRDALEALGPAGAGPDAVLVLRDGRAHAVLTRAELLSD